MTDRPQSLIRERERWRRGCSNNPLSSWLSASPRPEILCNFIICVINLHLLTSPYIYVGFLTVFITRKHLITEGSRADFEYLSITGKSRPFSQLFWGWVIMICDPLLQGGMLLTLLWDLPFRWLLLQELSAFAYLREYPFYLIHKAMVTYWAGLLSKVVGTDLSTRSGL